MCIDCSLKLSCPVPSTKLAGRSLPKQKSFDLNLRIASSYVQLERSTDAMAIYRKMLKKFKIPERQLEVEKLLKNLM